MSKVFRRPMFRKGGNVGEGIMTGIRDNFSQGSARERLAKVAAEYPSQALDPVTQFLIQGGMNLASQPQTGGGLFADVSTALKDPTSALFKGLAEEGQIGKKLALEGEILDIEGEREERIAKIKAAKESGLQKDYSAQRAYEDLVKSRTESRADLQSFQKPNIEQAYPRETSEYDTYILRNLRATDNEIGKEINANNYGFVPFDPKTGQFDFADLVPGAYYYYPPNKVFVQSVPPSEGEEGGIYQINPYTFQKSKVE